MYFNTATKNDTVMPIEEIIAKYLAIESLLIE